MTPKVYIGTANWGKPYGMNQVKVPHEEIDRILTVADAHDCGIETAWDYGCMEQLRGLSDQFDVIFKCDTKKQWQEAHKIIGSDVTVMKHHPPYGGWQNVSVYYNQCCFYASKEMVEVPFNIIDQRCGEYFDPFYDSLTEWLVRSVFMQGLAFSMPSFHGIPFYHLCWNFVRGNPNIDAIVVGVDSAAQLEDILSIPQYEIDYSRIGQDAWFRAY